MSTERYNEITNYELRSSHIKHHTSNIKHQTSPPPSYSGSKLFVFNFEGLKIPITPFKPTVITIL
jgi:hypothetical protein